MNELEHTKSIFFASLATSTLLKFLLSLWKGCFVSGKKKTQPLGVALADASHLMTPQTAASPHQTSGFPRAPSPQIR